MPIGDEVRRRAAWLASPAAAAATFVAIEVAAVVLITALGSRYLWFFGDEWAFVVTRRDLWAVGDQAGFLLGPHNEHWVTLPLLWYTALFEVIGLSAYWPYLVGTLLAHAVAGWFLRLLLMRCAFGPWAATGTAAVFVLLGSGAENLTWGFQLAFTGAVACGLVQLWCGSAGPARPGRRDALGAAAGVAALMFSGVGITYVVIAAAALALCGRWRRAFIAAAVPGLVFLVWYLAYGNTTQAPPSSARTELVSFVWRGLAHASESVLGLAGAGAVLLVVILFLLARAVGRRAEGWYLSLAAGAGAALFYGISALGRAEIGPEAALASRYVHVTAPLLLLALAPTFRAAADWLESGRGRALAFGTLLALTLLFNLSALAHFVKGRETIVAQARSRIEAAALLDLSGAPPDGMPEPVYSPNLTVAALRDLVAAGDLTPPASVDPEALADATARLLVTVDAPSSSGDGADAAPVTVTGPAARADGCYELDGAGAALQGRAGSGFSLSGPAPASALLTVEAGGAESLPVTVALAGGSPAAVRLAGPVTMQVVPTLPGVVLCPGGG